EDGVLGHLDQHVEIARGTAVAAGLALAAELEARARVDARGNSHVEAVGAPARPVAVAVGARARDDRALSVAGAAGLGDGKEALLEADLSRAPTLVARRRPGARLGAAPAAGGTGAQTRDGQRLLA